MARAFIPSPSQPLVDSEGIISQPWYDFFLFLFQDVQSSQSPGDPGDIPDGDESNVSLAFATLIEQQQAAEGVQGSGGVDPGALLSEDTHARNLANEALDNSTLAGYGNIRQTLNPALPDITAVFQTLPADAGSSGTNQRGVTAIPANDSIRFDELGVWVISASLSLDFTETNQGRTFDIRAFNITDGVPAGDGVQIAVGRNQAGVNYGFTALLSVVSAQLGDEVRLEIGNASATIAGVTLINYSFDVFRVSEKRV